MRASEHHIATQVRDRAVSSGTAARHCMMQPSPYPARMMQDLSPARRRILFALLFEGIGLAMTKSKVKKEG